MSRHDPPPKSIHETPALRHGQRSVHETPSLRHGQQSVHEAPALRHGQRSVHETPSLRHGQQSVHETPSLRSSSSAPPSSSEAMFQQGDGRREKKLQDIGQTFVANLNSYIRAFKLYSADNQIFLRPLLLMEEQINQVLAREGRFQLYGDTSTLYLNEVLLLFPFSALSSVEFVLQAFHDQNIAGITINRPVNSGQLKIFLQRFAPLASSGSNPSLEVGLVETESIDQVRFRLREKAFNDVKQESRRKADAQQYAVLLYARLLQFIQKLLDPQGPPPPMPAALRTIQEFIDLCQKQPVSFLGYTSELDQRSYEAYHLANTTFCSILFGRHLGLTRLQLLELGMAALQHNIGKSQIDPRILQKREPLSSREQAEIQKIPIYTAKKLIDAPFDWSLMLLAIIASGVNLPVPPSRDPKLPSEQGPWLASRIITLVAAFDALCTRRPFRHKLLPQEALAFMQKNHDGRFDPYFLRLFVPFFQSMISRSLQKAENPFDEPNDPRSWSVDPQDAPLGLSTERQITEYLALRRLPRRSPEQEQRLQVLKNLLSQPLARPLF